MTLCQGYLIGNGVTDVNYDGNALVPFVHGMGLISEGLYEVFFNSFTFNDMQIRISGKVRPCLKSINIFCTLL